MAQRSTPAPRRPVPWHVIIRIAGKVPADPATVRKVVRGEPVRGGIYERICAVLLAENVPFPGAADEG